jgi:metal-sulfur cluster biosynthetic enzyme
MTYEDQVRDALRRVVDPEIGINIVDLGLVYSVDVHDRHVHVAMTMTTPACPLHTYISQNAQATIRQLVPEVASVQVEMVWDPPWSPAMMSEAAKQQLGWME